MKLSVYLLLAAVGQTVMVTGASAAVPRKQAGVKPAVKKSKVIAATGQPSKSTPAKVAASKKKRPHLTPANASGVQDAKPGSLKAMAIGVIERKSDSDRHDLSVFAKIHAKDVNGALANLVLGFDALEIARYTEAQSYFQAARQVVSPVQQYGEYYLAVSHLASGEDEVAARLLDGFAVRYPSSSLEKQAKIKQGEALLGAKMPEDVIKLLQPALGTLPEASAGLMLGEAYRATGQLQDAVKMLQRVYYLTPTATEADQAERILRELRKEMGDAYPSPTDQMRVQRADRLFDAKQWRPALTEYQSLIASSQFRDHARVRAGACEFNSGQTQAAFATLSRAELSDAEADAERMATLAIVYRRMDRYDDMDAEVEQLGEKYPQSVWYGKSLVMIGNYYLVADDRAKSAKGFTEAFQKFPKEDFADLSHWRAAWWKYRERDIPEARRLFEEHIRLFPTSPHVSNAIYWLGRTLETDSPASAAICYRKLVSAFPNYYYGMIGRERLSLLSSQKAGANLLPTGLLEPIQRPMPDTPIDESSLSADAREHRQRAKLLSSAWLVDVAIEEIKSAIGHEPKAKFLLGREVAHFEAERGRYNVALSQAKRLLNGYFALSLEDLPRTDWELLFPLPYWNDIKRKSEDNQLDPYLVAGLIRQESEFNPGARSPSNAFGLMQLLPATAKRMAQSMSGKKNPGFQLASLTKPERNVAYGTFYLRMLLDMFNGSKEQALAGYNAGEHRVVAWLSAATFDEPAEFVESIPFTETREYVQAIMRNTELYRMLYADSNTAFADQPQKRSIVLTATPAAAVPIGSMR